MVIRKRLDIAGSALVFITTTVQEWTPIFVNPDIAHVAIRQLIETTNHFNVKITGYVLMPNHLHMLLGFQQIEDLSSIVQSYKSLSSRKLMRIIPNIFEGVFDNKTLWKPRFDDLIIWSEKQFNIKLNYIHNNPVKAGLVSNAVDYKYSSAGDWLSENKGLIEIDKNWTWT